MDISTYIPVLLFLTSGCAQDIDLTGCGSTKGCFLQPPECVSDTASCRLGVTWAFDPSEDFVVIEMFAPNPGWVAFGLSEDQMMGDDSVSACIYDGTADVNAIQTFNGPRNGSPSLTDPSFGLTLIQSSVEGTMLNCTFQRSVEAPPGGAAADINRFYSAADDYWMMLAWNGANTGAAITQVHSQRFLSASRVNLTGPVVNMESLTTTMAPAATTTDGSTVTMATELTFAMTILTVLAVLSKIFT